LADGVLVFIAVHALPRFGGVNSFEREIQCNYNRFDSTHHSITPEPIAPLLKHFKWSEAPKFQSLKCLTQSRFFTES